VAAIVGRPNVGKSTLFNVWAGRRRAIVSAQPGTTRDRLSAVVTADRSSGEEVMFELVDTGGVGVIDEEAISSEVTRQIETAVAGADVLIVLFDARDGALPLDRKVARLVRLSGRPRVVAANKCETDALEAEAANFLALGLGDVLPLSAEARVNLDQLKERVADLLPDVPRPEEVGAPARIAVVGRRNAGKSTFVNALAGTERVVVSEVPGTTRDAVDVRVEVQGRSIVIVDTAGVGRRREGRSGPDFFSLAASRRSMERAEAVVVLFDCTADFGTVEREIAKVVCEAYRPAVIVINKWDLAEGRGVTVEGYERYVTRRLPALGHAPIVFASALGNERVAEAAALAADLALAARVRHPTSALNTMVRRALNERKPPSPRGKFLKVFYATQTGISPPTVTLFVNHPRSFTQSYVRFLENRFREYWDEREGADGGGEVPVRIVLRGRSRKRAKE
jgi:GTP-binding protein